MLIVPVNITRNTIECWILDWRNRGNAFGDAANLRQMVESKTRRAPNLSMITGSGNMDFLFGLDLNLHCMSSFACRLLSIEHKVRFQYRQYSMCTYFREAIRQPWRNVRHAAPSRR
jgi:hypothetical protein